MGGRVEDIEHSAFDDFCSEPAGYMTVVFPQSVGNNQGTVNAWTPGNKYVSKSFPAFKQSEYNVPKNIGDVDYEICYTVNRN